MTKNKSRRIRSDRKIIAGILAFATLAITGASILSAKLQAAATDVTANFTVTEAHLYADDAETVEYNAENGARPSQSNSFKVKLDWTYESETPIANGDKITIAFLNEPETPTSHPFSVPNTALTNIYDQNSDIIGKWRVNNYKIEITFSDKAVGRTALSGTLTTARNIHGARAAKDDIVQTVHIGNYELQIKIKGFPTLGNDTSDAYLQTVNKSNNYITWESYAPSKVINELYKGEGLVAISPDSEMNDLIYELPIDPASTSQSFYVIARATIPGDWENGTSGPSGWGVSPNMTKFFTRKDSTTDQTYEDYKNSLNALEYGVYTDSATGAKTAVFNLGSLPSTVKFEDVVKSLGYQGIEDYVTKSMPMYTGNIASLFERLNGNNNIIDGRVSYIATTMVEYFPTAETPVSYNKTGTYSYKDGNNNPKTKQVSTTGTLITPSAQSTVKGEARVYVVDKVTGAPLSGINVHLEKKDGTTWTPVTGSNKTTNETGSVNVANLEESTEYRWVQDNYLEHYQTGSATMYSDAARTNSVTSFTIPQASGVTHYISNEKEKFTVTFNPGEHGTFTSITKQNIYYGDALTLPTDAQITGQNGWTFNGWTPAIENIVTGNKTYTATWKQSTITKNVSILWQDVNDEDQIRPEAVSVQLLQNNAAYGQPIEITATDKWAGKWQNLPEYNNDGSVKYTYTVKLANDIDDYTSESSVNSGGVLVITNSHMPSVIIKVTQIWDDHNNVDKVRPQSVTARLLVNGVGTGLSVQLTDDTPTKSFPAAAKYKDYNGNEAYIYTVTENKVDNYLDPVIAGSVEEGFTITLKHELFAPTPVSDETIAKITTSDKAPSGKLNLRVKMAAKDVSYPMPDGAENGEITYEVENSDEISLGEIEFTEEGEYEYEVTQEYVDQNNFIFDSSTWVVKYIIAWDEDTNSLTSAKEFYKDGEEISADQVMFVNNYEEPVAPKTSDSIMVWTAGLVVVTTSATLLGVSILKRR